MFDSRSRDDGRIVWRRRECLRCGARWTTIERKAGAAAAAPAKGR